VVAEAIKANQEAQRQSVGARLLADQALQAGAITLDQHTKFMKSSAPQQAAMTGTFVHAMAFHQDQLRAQREQQQIDAADRRQKAVDAAVAAMG
jgi:hypothetical protein